MINLQTLAAMRNEAQAAQREQERQKRMLAETAAESLADCFEGGDHFDAIMFIKTCYQLAGISPLAKIVESNVLGSDTGFVPKYAIAIAKAALSVEAPSPLPPGSLADLILIDEIMRSQLADAAVSFWNPEGIKGVVDSKQLKRQLQRVGADALLAHAIVTMNLPAWAVGKEWSGIDALVAQCLNKIGFALLIKSPPAWMMDSEADDSWLNGDREAPPEFSL